MFERNFFLFPPRNFFLFLPVVVLLAWAVVIGLLEVFLLGGNKPSLVSVVPGCLGLVALPVFLIWSLRYRIYDYYTYDYYSKKSPVSAIEEDQRSRASSARTQSASTNCGSLRLTRFFKVLADYVLFVVGVLFYCVGIWVVGFVVWYFVTSLQKSWRDTADLKEATIELLEETKKQNRAAGID